MDFQANDLRKWKYYTKLTNFHAYLIEIYKSFDFLDYTPRNLWRNKYYCLIIEEFSRYKKIILASRKSLKYLKIYSTII